MRSLAVMLVIVGIGRSLWAGPPEYDDDPFGDADFQKEPLILDQSHPTQGRGELAALFSTSMIDKYSSHLGGLVDFRYHLSETFGVALSAGYLQGNLTQIVEDANGILGNRVQSCIQNGGQCQLDPNVPDYRQVTGMVDAYLVWAPLYGKFNVVSELDVNLQVYAMVGAGVNGTRTVEATLRQGASRPTDYQLSGQGFGDGGFFGDPFFNLSGSVGLKVYLTDWVDLRGEVRGLVFFDQFDFNQDGTLDSQDTYAADHFFGQVGLGFTLF